MENKDTIHLLKECDAVFVCGSQLSGGMRGEIVKAVKFNIPVFVMNQYLYTEIINSIPLEGQAEGLIVYKADHPFLAMSAPLLKNVCLDE